MLMRVLVNKQAGYVHRDIRWPNVACDALQQRYFLLDLEMCAKMDQVPTAAVAVQQWDVNTLVHGHYTAASDLYQLGLLLQLHTHLCKSRAGTGFVRALCLPPNKQTQTQASQWLSHPWICCPGIGCTAAGAVIGCGA